MTAKSKKKSAAASPSFTLVSVPFESLSSVNILYIGAGFVGACSAAVSADSGHRTLVYDIDERRTSMLGSGDRDTIENCLFEEGLGDLLVRNRERIEFTSDYKKVEAFLDVCDAVFMCLPTPEVGETGASDLSYYNAAADRLARALARRDKGRQSRYMVIVNKSTVPIAMADRTAEILRKRGVKSFGVVSNPEFLVEGKAVSGSLKPDRLVIGAWREKDFAVLRRIYQRFVHAPGVEYVEVNPKEAAAGKLLANFVLFNKLAVCFDVIGRTCEAFPDLEFENVRRILSGDPRIGHWGLYNSLYAGGSCLIKDARSLSSQLKEAGKEPLLVNETYLANRRQLLGLHGPGREGGGLLLCGQARRAAGRRLQALDQRHPQLAGHRHRPRAGGARYCRGPHLRPGGHGLVQGALPALAQDQVLPQRGQGGGFGRRRDHRHGLAPVPRAGRAAARARGPAADHGRPPHAAALLPGAAQGRLPDHRRRLGVQMKVGHL